MRGRKLPALAAFPLQYFFYYDGPPSERPDYLPLPRFALDDDLRQNFEFLAAHIEGPISVITFRIDKEGNTEKIFGKNRTSRILARGLNDIRDNLKFSPALRNEKPVSVRLALCIENYPDYRVRSGHPKMPVPVLSGPAKQPITQKAAVDFSFKGFPETVFVEDLSSVDAVMSIFDAARSWREVEVKSKDHGYAFHRISYEWQPGLTAANVISAERIWQTPPRFTSLSWGDFVRSNNFEKDASVVTFQVSADGKATILSVEGDDQRAAEAARETISKTEWRPATDNGVPVESTSTFTIYSGKTDG